MGSAAAAIEPTAGRPELPLRRRSGRETAPELPPTSAALQPVPSDIRGLPYHHGQPQRPHNRQR